MINIGLDQRKIQELRRELDDLATKRLPREIEIAVNATGKAMVKELGSAKTGIRAELAVKSRDVKQAVDFKRARKTRPVAVIRIGHQRRFWLQAFGARQTRKGVSYRVDPRQGRQRVANAFLIRPAGHVYKRPGRARGPLVKLHGASPLGAYRKRRLGPKIKRFGQRRLLAEIDKRIRRLELKRTGVIA